MAVLTLVGTIMTGCASDDIATEKPQQNNNSTVTLTTTIVLDGSATTRALDADGKKTFAKGDKIAIIYKNTSDKTVKAESSALETTDISSDGKKAKITVTLNAPKASGQLRCIYPAAMAATTIDTDVNVDHNLTIDFISFLNNQDGKLETIASNYDLAIFDGTFTSDAELPTEVTLKNQLAIVEFTIKDDAGNDITSKITQLGIEQGPGKFYYSFTREAAEGPIYVAMMPSETAKENISIHANDGKTFYEKDVKNITLLANNLYPVNVKMQYDMLNTPLTLEATEDGTTITAVCGREIAFQYAINGGTKIDVYSESGGESFNIKLDAGEFVEFYSKRYDVGDYRLHILPDKETYIYGNVMSLIDDSGQGFANDKAVGENALSYLFFNAEKLAFHPKKRIVLPATTLNSYCYKNMFSGCKGLTELPADLLPATTLAPSCYCSMFNGCTGLTSLPEKLLPATTLATDCYDFMFSGCKGLETLPADLLPATTLAMNCYKEMFHGCTGLTVAPDLPAPTLYEGCYSTMFYGCTKLSSVKCLATPKVFGSALNNWLMGAGTAEGCERKLYVDPSMINDGNWKLDTSGEDGKRWTTAVFAY